ncbi:MAG TPA: MarR family winged helix-turn-helix transcriptional regulator [Rhizomicrobium sp.]|nr:MarR family winged helix-turn-helix transcriptional regulator [Rhizomicrobium sp.]HVZ91834.1 MarR family winged helix-turn-helix transcriptional regulator [Rhizomicrobium sp.]
MANRPFYSVEKFQARRSIGYLIKRLNNLIVPGAEALFADAEFTFSQWVVLMAVRDGIADTCGELARHLDHDSGATTRLVDQLEKRGYLRRRRSTEDRRVVHLRITATGRALAKSLMPRVIDFWNEALEEFSPAEAQQLIALLTRLLARIEARTLETRKQARAAK